MSVAAHARWAGPARPGMGRREWIRKHARATSHGGRVPDAAPHGEAAGYSMALFAEEELAVMEDAGMFAASKPPVIVAHSFGGFVTMKAGADFGNRLTGVVIIDSPVNPPVRGENTQGGDPKGHRPRPHNVYPSLAAALALALKRGGWTVARTA